MRETDRKIFDGALDLLADTLSIERLSSEVKNEYWKSLKGYSSSRYISALNDLKQSHIPFGKNDFPVIAEIHEACKSVKESLNYWNCPCCGAQFPANGVSACPCECPVCMECGKCKTHDSCGHYGPFDFSGLMKSLAVHSKQKGGNGYQPIDTLLSGMRKNPSEQRPGGSQEDLNAVLNEMDRGA